MTTERFPCMFNQALNPVETLDGVHMPCTTLTGRESINTILLILKFYILI